MQTAATATRSGIGHVWQARGDRYSQLRGALAGRGAIDDPAATAPRRVEMHYIGG